MWKTKCTTVVEDVVNGVGCVCAGTVGIWENLYTFLSVLL